MSLRCARMFTGFDKHVMWQKATHQIKTRIQTFLFAPIDTATVTRRAFQQGKVKVHLRIAPVTKPLKFDFKFDRVWSFLSILE